MTETSRAFPCARRPASPWRTVAAWLVLLLAAALGGQVVAWSPVTLTAPWTRIRHSLLASNDWVLSIPDDPTASRLGQSARRSKPSSTLEVAARPERLEPERPDTSGRSLLPEGSLDSSRWPPPSSPRGPPEPRSI